MTMGDGQVAIRQALTVAVVETAAVAAAEAVEAIRMKRTHVLYSPLWIVAILTALLSALAYHPLILAIYGLLAMLAAFSLICLAETTQACYSTSWRAARFHVLGACCLWLSVVATSWPLRTSFAVTRPVLDRMVADIGIGKTVDIQQAVGPFRIRQVDTSTIDGQVCFWTEPTLGDRVGFVYDPFQKGLLNPWLQLDLGNGWYYLEED